MTQDDIQDGAIDGRLRQLVEQAVALAADELGIAEPVVRFVHTPAPAFWGSVELEGGTIYVNALLDLPTATAVCLHEVAHISARQIAGPPLSERDQDEHEGYAKRFETWTMHRLGFVRREDTGQYVKPSHKNGTSPW